MDLKDKTIFITGASSGIGEAVAYDLAKYGAKLALTYRNGKAAGEKIAAKCRELGSPDVLLLHLDLRENESIRNAVKTAVEHFGAFDSLINNAGVVSYKRAREQTFDEIENQVRVNLEGLMKMTIAALPHVRRMIINVSSGLGIRADAELVPYSATKFGVRGFTQGLAKEEPSLKIFSVNPGTTATRMTGFTGEPVVKVAEIIAGVVRGKFDHLESGSDINTWEVKS